MTTRHTVTRTWLLWLVGAFALPIAGLAGAAVVGRVDYAAPTGRWSHCPSPNPER
ncbi:MAG TPA: hypothetical protein VGB75_17975 [Jatrophihabitans sp.]|jgi:hypothetical protein|uniref:hypothetical protein n=1 Tax=Jatrophihabitans sp. TaxID=1932789 RepID=UPI002F07B341